MALVVLMIFNEDYDFPSKTTTKGKPQVLN